MAPKKQQQQKQRTTAKRTSSSSSSGPRLQISAENESRLRRLLLNSGRTAQPAAAPVDESLSKAQKAKKLKTIYEKLSCEGFTNPQIELALSALKEGATFDASLDWLCLNLPSNELPLKFSSGISQQIDGGGSVRVLLNSRDDWTPSVDASPKINDGELGVSLKTKGRGDDESLDSFQPSQADWIKRYVEQQEEDESRTWEDDFDEGLTEKISEPRPYDVIAKEYCAARLEAMKAKEKRDKKSQEQAGNIIHKLKQECSALGLSVDILESEFENEQAFYAASEATNVTSMPDKQSEGDTFGDVERDSIFVLHAAESTSDGNETELCTSKDSPVKPTLTDVPAQETIVGEEESGDVELGNFFSEDGPLDESLSTEVYKLQKKEKMKEMSEKNLEKLGGIWKKGDPPKIPKAVLHQLCQRSGWEAPNFNKVRGKGNNFSYTVSVLRKASGWGKSRKAGGLITLQLPDEGETFESVEDAQNRVAAFALYHLFSDLPIHLILTEPYASLVFQWKEGDSSINIEESEEVRRASFVDSLLNADGSASTVPTDVTENVFQENQESLIEGNKNSTVSGVNPIFEREHYHKEVESSYLRREQENKLNMQKYKVGIFVVLNKQKFSEDMLKTRAALPIAHLKGDILKLLKENNVLVVCGETGSGKTTQVSQFILDDMIESGLGGHCNIICTQPRRIAAISVAERVADERCEPSPGSNGSLVGYQVRLDSARNEKTKLLFCTTGILLRKIAGDKNLTGITHVIVDEVHERSLLGDFLLIVLKNLIEKQSAHKSPKLKVILMSATVDSNLFSRYFGDCPVITAEGRTHPVTNYFLEDIYESINYRLASDSAAAIRYETFTKEKGGPVNNRRGKKNLVLSAWGDDSLLSEEYVNPHYVPDDYPSYSEQTQQNLKRLNEDFIDYDLLEDLVCHIDETCGEGAVLVFLPGVAEIHMLVDKLAASYRFGGQSSDWILPLHSSIASTDQKKVIVATNIAETSLTIDDVVYVIDCGKHKENRYNPQKKLSSMVEDWISQANARQRRGRAGRVKPGICFCLYTCHRFEKLMRRFQVPEMLRTPLVELCLQIKFLSLGHIKPFLSKAIEPPKDEAMTSAISLLYEVGALEGDELLTPLGHHLAKLPVDVLIGKMMIYGGIFGCLSPILSISAFLSHKSPFVYPKDERENVERAKLALLTDKLDGPSNSYDVDRQSDHLLMMIAYMKWEKILREINGRKKENLDIWLSDASQPFNLYSHHSPIVKAILFAGLYPNVAATEKGIAGVALGNLKQSAGLTSKGHPSWYDGRREVHIHPSSINSNWKEFRYPFLVFLEKVETNKVFLRDTTIISPYSVLLFGGSINVQHQTGLVTIDGWLKLKAPAQTAVLFKELRSTLHSILKELIRKPENVDVASNKVISSIIHLLLEEDKPPV
ncbi:ATP-dependent RNA helicase DHX29 [Morus notabilis]|uniref:RNA helicase n=1 Tax=Morus notabilis TaxID=981085 RepID=W9QMV9_9ROSA|nr:ATP-dependent RNA helicase DHX29 [Morus notabilis]